MLDELLNHLALTRQQLADAEKDWREIEMAFREETAPMKRAFDAAKDSEREAYQAVVDTAMSDFADTGDKSLNEDVTFRRETVLDYDPAEVLDWAIREGYTDYLTLDTKAFEKAVKAGECDGSAPVTTTQTYKPTIRQKLGHRLLDAD